MRLSRIRCLRLVGGLDRRFGRDIAAGAVPHDLPGLQHLRVGGTLERQSGVLLDLEIGAYGRTCIPVMSSPSNVIDPERTGRRPDTVRIVVVLPAPFAPIKVTTDPSSTANEMSRIASVRP